MSCRQIAHGYPPWALSIRPVRRMCCKISSRDYNPTWPGDRRQTLAALGLTATMHYDGPWPISRGFKLHSFLRRIVGLRWCMSLVMCFILASCAGQPVEDLGDSTYRIDCSGGHHDWSGCSARAQKVCEGGYDIVSQLSDEGSSGVGVNDWRYRGSEVTRAMTVKCDG